MKQGRLAEHDLSHLRVDPDAASLARELGLGEGLPTSPDRERFRFPKGVRVAFRSPGKTPTREWMERHFPVLEGAMQGPWRNENNPSLVGVMDAWDFPSVEIVTHIAAVQLGKSKLIEGFFAHAADEDPGPCLFVYPDELSAKERIDDRFVPLLTESSRLARYKSGRTHDIRKGKISLRHMDLYLAWPRSPQTLGGRPIRYVFGDEVDNYPEASGKLSSPISLVLDRQRTFLFGRKAYFCSSPSNDSGNIWVLGKEAQTMFLFQVQCPFCLHWQHMEFGDYEHMEIKRLRWPQDVRDWREIKHKRLAWYECAHCGGQWDDSIKRKILRFGEWRCPITGLELHDYLKEHRPFSVAFRNPAYNAPYVSFSDIAAAFLRAMTFTGETRNIELRRFFNNYEAMPSRTYRPKRKTDEILALRDDRPRGLVPEGGRVACLVAGCDTQKTGFWYRIRAIGWGHREESWGVTEGFAPWSGEDGFAALNDVLWNHQYKDSHGVAYPIRLVVIDAMGHKAKEVYDWTKLYTGRAHPLQGVFRLPSPVVWSNQERYPGTNIPIPGGVMLARTNVTFFKNVLATKIAGRPEQEPMFHLHAETSEEYARHMVVEEFDENKQVWICDDKDENHLWDCEVYCEAAQYMLQIRQWPKPEKHAHMEEDDEDHGSRLLSGRIRNPWNR